MKKKDKAFTLIEVVLALAIIGIGILPILSMYPSALKITTKATKNEEWSRVSMSVLDYVKSRGYNTLVTNSALWTGTGGVTDKTYSFIKNGTTYNSYSGQFNTDFLGGNDLFYINTKGIPLENYKFSVFMEKLQASSATSGGVNLYSQYDLKNNKIVTSSTSSSIIFGIIKIREKTATSGAINEELIRDMKFIITPIDNWKE